MPLSSSRSYPLVCTYYIGLYLREDADDIQLLTILVVFVLSILAGVQFLPYAAEREVPDYFVGLLRTNHVGDGM